MHNYREHNHREAETFAVRSFGGDDPQADSLRAFFRVIATAQGWQAGDDLSTDSVYAPFSVYFALYQCQALVGGLHIVRGNAADLLPTRSVWTEIEFAGRRDVADVFLLALSPGVRGHRHDLSEPADGGVAAGKRISGTRIAAPLFWTLGIALWQWCQQEEIHDLVGISTPRTVALYRRLGWPLAVVGAARPHWGEPCLPFLLSVASVQAEIVRRSHGNARLYQHIVRDAQASLWGALEHHVSATTASSPSAI